MRLICNVIGLSDKEKLGFHNKHWFYEQVSWRQNHWQQKYIAYIYRCWYQCVLILLKFSHSNTHLLVQKSFFVGPLIPLFWTSGDVCPGFQSQGRFLTCTLFACMLFLRFTSGATPTDCIEVSMAAKLFWSTYLQRCPQVFVALLGVC